MKRIALASLFLFAAASAGSAQTFIGDSTPIFGRNSGTGQIGPRTAPNTFQSIGTIDPVSQAWRPVLQPPTTSILGGVLAKAAVANRFITGVGTDGTISAAQPAFGDLSGVLLSSQVPAFSGGFTCVGLYCALSAPTASILGGVLAKAGAANQFVTGIDTTGTPVFAQPSFSNLAGSLACGQTPAETGDVSSAAGSCALTLATVNASPGSVGSSTSIPSFTVNAKGLVTATSGNPVVAAAGTLTGSTLAAAVTGSSLTSLGTVTTGTWNATPIGAAYIATGAAASNVGTLGGDLTGTLPNPILPNVNVSPGAFGSASSIPAFSTNAKGQILSVVPQTVVAPAGTLTGTTLPSNVTNSSLATLAAGAAASNIGALGGDLAGTLPNPTIAAAAVSNAKLASVPASSLKCGVSAGAPIDCTGSQAAAIVAPFLPAPQTARPPGVGL